MTVVLPVNSIAADISKDAAVAQLASVLSTYQTLTGDFQQTLHDQDNTLIQSSKGTFSLKKPGLFYWETQTPFPQLLVSNLQTVWLYDPDLEQVTIRPYHQVTGDSPALLLSGNVDDIHAVYQVSWSAPHESKQQHFRLEPRQPGNHSFTQIELFFANNQLTRMVLTDTLQQVTTFHFQQLTLNPPIDNARFTFVPPPGVDVIIDEQ